MKQQATVHIVSSSRAFASPDERLLKAPSFMVVSKVGKVKLVCGRSSQPLLYQLSPPLSDFDPKLLPSVLLPFSWGVQRSRPPAHSGPAPNPLQNRPE